MSSTRDGIATMVNPHSDLVSRDIFVDDDIYQQELEQIFARSWSALAGRD